MQHHLTRRFWLAGWIVLVLISAAGCFQPAGGGLEATLESQALPTFTPFPTETSLPPPTETPTEFILPTEAPTIEVFDVGTQVAMLQDEPLEPIFQTATAMYLQGVGQPLDVPTLDPMLQQATNMVREATETAAFPATQTAAALFGFPTATFLIQPTSGPILQGQDCVYEVQPGDPNLYRIGLKFGVPYQDIAARTNMVNPNIIHVGDRLVIPGCGTTGYVPPPTSTPGAGVPGATPPPGGGSGTYVVQQGDTLFALSLRWGTTVSAIAAINGIQNVNLIYIDQVLTIP
ncbi:MAG: LysM peptidoglycan-binding domain-containing protein [Anaerolineae bacterium]|nr:LysM peptidoglycan-binding domain-containing protein [Anaerolineae bacterium]